jgi:hypothetical protein
MVTEALEGRMRLNIMGAEVPVEPEGSMVVKVPSLARKKL